MTSAGASELFKCPDHDTPMNSTSFIASYMTRDHWIEYFFCKAGGTKEVGKCFGSSSQFRYQETNSGFNTPSMPLNIVIPSTLHRISTQVYLGWTYDPKLKLQKTVLPPSETDMMMLSSVLGDLGFMN